MWVLAWPIFAVWIGLGILVALLIVGTIGWCTFNLASDVVLGDEGTIWCPVYKQEMKVKGIPRRFRIEAPFVGLSKCERWGDGRVRCAKGCLATPSFASSAGK